MGEPKDRGKSRLPLAVTATAIVCLVFFAVLSVALILAAKKSTEVHWSRLVFVYSGIEAVVFAAAGALFGSRIERNNTDAQASRADRAEESAKRNAEEAREQREHGEAGRALLAALETEAETSEGGGRRSGAAERVRSGAPSRVAAGEDSSDPVDRLVRLGRRLFGTTSVPGDGSSDV